MEDIIKKIVEIDNKSQEIIKEEIERKNNIEEAIEVDFNTQKVVIDLEYKDEIDKKRNEKLNLFENKKKQIDENLRLELEKIQNFYDENSKTIISNIVHYIKNKEN